MTPRPGLSRQRRFLRLLPLCLVLGGCKPSAPASTPPAHALAGASLHVVVAFCVGPTGSATKVRVVQGSGDAKVDEIARAQVERWRFEDKPEGACSEADFDIQFSR